MTKPQLALYDAKRAAHTRLTRDVKNPFEASNMQPWIDRLWSRTTVTGVNKLMASFEIADVTPSDQLCELPWMS